MLFSVAAKKMKHELVVSVSNREGVLYRAPIEPFKKCAQFFRATHNDSSIASRGSYTISISPHSHNISRLATTVS